MIKSAIFDLDGTLLNTLQDLKESTNFALEKYGYEPISLEQTRKFVGNGVKKLIERALPNGLENPNFENCLNDFKKNYKENMYNHTAPYSGIVEVLKELKNEGVKIGVVSNKFDAAVKELCKRYFLGLIDIAVGESKSVKKKPAPDSVLRAMEEMGVLAQNTLYIGDSEVDVQTSKNAKLCCIGVTWGFRDRKVLEDEGADYIINEPQDILRIAKEIK